MDQAQPRTIDKEKNIPTMGSFLCHHVAMLEGMYDYFVCHNQNSHAFILMQYHKNS